MSYCTQYAGKAGESYERVTNDACLIMIAYIQFFRFNIEEMNIDPILLVRQEHKE